MKAPQQVEMPFAKPTGKQLHAISAVHWEDDVLPAIRRAIEGLTSKECTELFDASPSNISDALAQRADKAGRVKRVDAEWLVALLVGAPHGIKLDLLTALCDVAGYMAPERKRKLSGEEKAEAWRAATAKRLSASAIAEIEREIEESVG